MGKALFTIISSMCTLERDLLAERVKSGLVNAKAKGKVLWRPRTRNSELIKELSNQKMSYRKIAQLASRSIAAIYRELASLM